MKQKINREFWLKHTYKYHRKLLNCQWKNITTVSNLRIKSLLHWGTAVDTMYITDQMLGYITWYHSFDSTVKNNWPIVSQFVLLWQSLCHVDINIECAVVQNSPTAKQIR